ncbi:hypothetical protein [Lysinibacillus xylanilyticus]|uniref:hypothetical protein n=1 Tax=Lysinibacillus xylanilyticus TaxID=582475 RepID=UPI0036DCD361
MLYPIWSEGYKATGQSAGAMCHGEAEGETFKEACVEFASTNKRFKEYFDEERMTYWGCRLFDNSVDARKSFG